MANLFLGHFDVVLEELLKKIKIDLVLIENKPINKAVMGISRKNKIKCMVVNNYLEILKAVKQIDYIKLCFVASFGIILKKKFIKKCQNIVNLHLGDLNVCRWRHPLPVSILNKHKTMGITVHLIKSQRIDAGPLLAKVLLPINYKESYKRNELRLLKMSKLITNFLIEDYLENKGFTTCFQPVKRSAYFRPLKKQILEKIIKGSSLRQFLK